MTPELGYVGLAVLLGGLMVRALIFAAPYGLVLGFVALVICSSCGTSRAVEPAEPSPCEKKKKMEVCYTDKEGELGCHYGEDQ